MRRFWGLLLLAALLGNAAIAATASGSPKTRASQLKKELAAVDQHLSGTTSGWKTAVEVSTELALLQSRMALLNDALGELAAEQKGSDSESRALKEKMAALQKEIAKLDPAALHAVDYYLNPANDTLSVRDAMYLDYEFRSDELSAFKQLLQQKQRVLQELLLLDPGSAVPARTLDRTGKMLELIGRLESRLRTIADLRLTKINETRKALAEVEHDLGQKNIWQKSYTSYQTYVAVKNDLETLDARIVTLRRQAKTLQEKEELDGLVAKQRILTDQLALLQTHGASPFTDLLKPEEIQALPEINNPIDIFAGLSFNKKLSEQLTNYEERGKELKRYLRLLMKKRELLKTLSDITVSEEDAEVIKELDLKIEKYQTAYSTMEDTADVYAKHVEEIELKVNRATEEQLYKLMNIGLIILFLLVFFFAMKQIAKHYISDNERFYMANKVITFANMTLIILVLLFNYIENVSYLVTVLGFASAGIAIAMKDWFMSMLGWLVIVFGGSIHVGDRVRVDKDGMKYVGDVLDISLLRITILEDITLTSYLHNRRAGRIIFIPNNYVFTHMIANYTHVSLKTVWDGIDITITFDSDHKKAVYLAKEICRKYAKGYTDITRKQLNKLRSRYSLKNTNVEPRVFSFAEPNGVRISSWYLTNAYATLTLRSTISMEIIDAYNKADDIFIAYPTQTLNLQRAEKRVPPFETGEEEPPV